MIDKIITYWPREREIPERYQACVDANILFAEKIGIPFELMRDCPFEYDKEKCHRDTVELLKVKWLIENPAWMWVDADAVICRWIDFALEKDKLYLINHHGAFDTFVMIANNDKKTLGELLEHSKTMKSIKSGWVYRYLKSKRGTIGIIPNNTRNEGRDRYFYHKSLYHEPPHPELLS